MKSWPQKRTYSRKAGLKVGPIHVKQALKRRLLKQHISTMINVRSNPLFLHVAHMIQMFYVRTRHETTKLTSEILVLSSKVSVLQAIMPITLAIFTRLKI